MRLSDTARVLAALSCLSYQVAALVPHFLQKPDKFMLGAWEAFQKDQPHALDKRQQENAYCIEDSLLQYLESAATNTAECSSYLSIPPTTATTTVYPTM